jgi:hypothetical protein
MPRETRKRRGRFLVEGTACMLDGHITGSGHMRVAEILCGSTSLCIPDIAACTYDTASANIANTTASHKIFASAVCTLPASMLLISAKIASGSTVKFRFFQQDAATTSALCDIQYWAFLDRAK